MSAKGKGNQDPLSQESPVVGDPKFVLTLDAHSFPKLVPSPRYATVVLVFDKAHKGTYATESIRSDYYAFAKKAQTEGEAEEVLFTQVIVNGADNKKLATRIGFKTEYAFPQMFVIPQNQTEAIPYPSNEPYRLYELAQFVSKHSTLFLKQAGRTKFLLSFRADFYSAKNTADRQAIITAARHSLATSLPSNEIEDTKYYIDLFERAVDDAEYTVIAEEIRKQEKISKNPALHEMERRIALLRVYALRDTGVVAEGGSVSSTDEL